MWVALEGADGAGKTTLATAFNEMTGAKVVHRGPPRSADSALDEVIGEEPYSSYLPGQVDVDDLVSDRLHWGEVVYGPIYRPQADQSGWGALGRGGFRYAELYLESRGVVTVLVDVDPELAVRRLERLGDDYVKLDDIPDIVARYRQLNADSLTGCCIVASFDDTDPHKVMAEVADLAHDKEVEHQALAEWRHYAGPRYPLELVVCRPDRNLRLSVVDTVSEQRWQQLGFCSSASTPASLDELRQALCNPRVIGLGQLPGAIEHWVYECGGDFAPDPTSLVVE